MLSTVIMLVVFVALVYGLVELLCAIARESDAK
jgi:hypothetical protein